MGCELFSEIVNTTSQVMKSVKAGKSTTQKATVRFAHSETLLPIFAQLGLFADDVESHFYQVGRNERNMFVKNFLRHKSNRRWQTGTMIPFAANLAVILYVCGNQSKQDNWYVKLYHNELPLMFPKSLCPMLNPPHPTLCPISVFENAVQQVISQCDIEEICSLNDKN